MMLLSMMFKEPYFICPQPWLIFEAFNMQQTSVAEAADILFEIECLAPWDPTWRMVTENSNEHQIPVSRRAPGS